MKQHITPDQLSDSGKQKLREWWKPALGDYFSWDEFTTQFINYIDLLDEEIGFSVKQLEDPEFKKDHLPLLSIGQMLEFLYENNQEKWGLSGIEQIAIKDLCDDLWREVVEVLKKQ